MSLCVCAVHVYTLYSIMFIHVFVAVYICTALAPVLACLSQIKQLPVGRATVRTCAAPAKRAPPQLKEEEEETGKVS